MSNDGALKLSAGALVICYFPDEQAPFAPSRKSRPALVLRVFQKKSDNSIWVEVAYASTQRTTEKGAVLEPYEFEVDPNNNPASGLNEVTRFDLERRTTLPWNDLWFRAPGNSQRLRPFGKLAEADIAHAKEVAAKFPSRQPSYHEKDKLAAQSAPPPP